MTLISGKREHSSRRGLIRRRVAGRSHFCRLRPETLASARAWLKHYERFWTQRLDALENLLEQEASSND